MMPQDGGTGNHGDHKSTDEPNDNTGDELTTPNQHNTAQTRLFFRDLIIAGVLGTGIWVVGEHLTSHGHTIYGGVVNFFASVIFFAALPLAALRHWHRPFIVWSAFGAFCIILAIVFIESARTISPKLRPSRPHLAFWLRSPNMREDDKSWLTNDFLIITNIGIATDINGCLVIPVQSGESNLDLKFTVKNDSEVELRNLQIAISLPAEWQCATDSNKWHDAESFTKPVSKTNDLQSWWIPFPFVVFPNDEVHLPPFRIIHLVTNSPGFFAIRARTSSSTNLIGANTLLVPAEPNPYFVKPVAVLGHLDSNNTLRVWMSAKEVEESQQ